MNRVRALKLIGLIAGMIFLQLSVFGQQSAFQRLAFNAVDVDLGVGEASAPISSYCYDHDRESPKILTGFKFVHLDGHSSVTKGNLAPMALEEALNKGYIELSGNDYDQFNFINKSGQHVKIKTTGPSVVGDVAGDNKWISSSLISNALDVKKGKRAPLYAMSLQERLWLRRQQQEVYLVDGLLQSGFSAADFLRADQTFRNRHHVRSEAGMTQAIWLRSYQLAQKKYKVGIYQRLNLLAGSDPTAAQLLKADATFRRLKGVPPGVEFSLELQETARELDNEAEVFKDQYGLDSSATYEAVRQVEQDYKNKNGLKTATDFKLSLANDAANISAARESAMNALFRFDNGPQAEAIQQIQHAAGLPETGSLDHSPVMHLLSTYEFTVNLLLGGYPHANAPEYIQAVIAVRQKLRLSHGFVISTSDWPYLDKLTKILIQLRYEGDIRDGVIVGDQLVILQRAKASYLQADNLSVIREVPILDNATIHKLSPDLFIVDGRLVPVGGLNKAVENLPDQQKENCVFGESLSVEDCQNIVRTHQIKRLVLGEAGGPPIHFSSGNCDFPQQPQFKEDEDMGDWVLQFPVHKLGSPAAGSGINGELNVEVGGTLKSRLEQVKTVIRNVMKELRGHPDEDLTTELWKELKKTISL